MEDYIKKELLYVVNGTLKTYEGALKSGSTIINGVDKLYVLEDQIRLTATPFSFCHTPEERQEIVNVWKEVFVNHPKIIELLNTIKI